MKYNPISKKPVAKFFYKGTHSHPVKRTIVITEINRTLIKGYELREGFTVRELESAPIKSFRKDKIAKFCQLRRDSLFRSENPESTLNRMSMFKLKKVGV